MTRTDKPRWPHARHTKMYAHPSGQWAKKVDGLIKYFGVWSDPDSALRKWLDTTRALEAGIHAPETTSPGVPLRVAVNQWIDVRAKHVASGTLSPGQFSRYRKIGRHLIATLGADTPCDQIGPQSFARLRASLPGGPVHVKNQMTWLRTFFGFASEFFGFPLRYAGQFDKPSATTLRMAATKRQLFTPTECQALLAAASTTLKPMLLLALNCGFGQADISALRTDNLHETYHDFPRAKNGIPRICPLWPETIQALAKYDRPNSIHPKLVFITRFGREWIVESVHHDAAGGVLKTVRCDSVAHEFVKLCKTSGVAFRPFYTLRHTFRSVADQIADTTAIDAIMGHGSPGMKAVYVQLMADKMVRLRNVTDHVYSWLYGTKIKPTGGRSRKVGKVSSMPAED